MPTIRRIIAEWHPDFSPRQTAHLRALYDREVAFTDEQIGRLLAGLKQRRLDTGTAIMLIADHGESFGEHELWLHGGGLYRNEVRVPLLLHYPGHLPAGRVLGGPVSAVDIMPTLLDLADAPIPATVQGASLLPLISGGERAGRRRAFAVAGDYASTVITRDWHLIYHPETDEAAEYVELYRPGSDPAELANLAAGPLAGEVREVRDSLRARLLDWFLATGDVLSRALDPRG
jgi:arylsulfatase A-like enzyme